MKIHQDIQPYVRVYTIENAVSGGKSELKCIHGSPCREENLDSRILNSQNTGENPNNILDESHTWHGNYTPDDLANPNPGMISFIREKEKPEKPVIFCPAPDGSPELREDLFSMYYPL